MDTLSLLATILGWVSFTAWSISFYPQTVLNYRRKSVFGLSLDFVLYNVSGFLFYSIYCMVKYWEQHHYNEQISVDPNDIAFAIHAFVLMCVQAYQCVIYDRRGQNLNIYHTFICAFLWLLCIYNVVLAAIGVLAWSGGSATRSVDSDFNVIEYLGFAKSFISFIKYAPQAFLNWRRQSTVGWSITNILLDLTGGICSLIQQCLDGYTSNDFHKVFLSNIPKLLLSIESIAFDLVFIVQHYCLYYHNQHDEALEQEEPKETEYHVLGQPVSHVQHVKF